MRFEVIFSGRKTLEIPGVILDNQDKVTHILPYFAIIHNI